MKLVIIRAIENNVSSRYLPTLGIGYIKTYLEKYIPGLNVVITDSVDELIREKPDIVAISSVTQNFDIAIRIANHVIASLYVPIIVGGHHISALPHTLPECFDIGVIGEGEETMRALIEIFLSRGQLHPNSLRNISGIVFHISNEIMITTPRPLIKNLNVLPYPYRGKIKEDYAHMVTSRGCPYDCIFCSSSKFWGRIRFFSAQYVVNEMTHLINNNSHLKEILLWDDLFIADRKRLKEIVRLIQINGIQNDVSFSCTVRANLVDDELCFLLKSMNVKVISMGLESGSDKSLKYLKQGNVTVENNRNAVLLLKKYGFVVRSSFIMGCPDETPEEILETLQFVKEVPIDLGATYILMPLPGTELWNQAKERKLVSENMDWSKFNAGNENEKTIILSKILNQKDILKYHSMFKDEWTRKAIVFDAHKPKNISISSIIKAITHPRSTYLLAKNIILYNLKYKEGSKC